MLPFLITVKTDHANTSYNKLILKQRELSSVFYLNPKDANIKESSMDFITTLYEQVSTSETLKNAFANSQDF